MTEKKSAVQTADETRNAISKNLIALRTAHHLTQAELAEKLSYSDKAISKWERGESLPEICVLKQISQMFDVTLDWLTTPHSPEKSSPPKKPKISRHFAITALSVAGVWLMIMVAFATAWIMGHVYWQMFVVALPLTCIALFVCNILWGKLSYGAAISSVFWWTLLTSVFVIFLNSRLWILFVLGVPLQLCTLFIFGILAKNEKSSKKEKNNEDEA
jgi:transcriptional regulator with XRE-family HTH domain